MPERNHKPAPGGAGPFAGGGVRARLVLVADWLAAAVAASLPWSTSVSGILIALWLIAVLPTLDAASVWRELRSPAGGLPVLLWVVAALGMLWSDVDWKESFDGLRAYHKLLMIPLLLTQFRRSGRGQWVVLGFFVSSTVLLVISWGLWVIPGLPWRGGHVPGVPVKDYIAQSEIFAICAFALLGQADGLWRTRRFDRALLLVVLAALFIANVVYVATARTTLVIIVALLVLLTLRQFGWKGIVAVCLIGGIAAGLVWTSSPQLRERIYSVDAGNSTGQRLDFWKRSIEFVSQAPAIGHGTGTIGAVFQRARLIDPNVPTTNNPHNQVLTVAIQLGLLGASVLLAMWFAHLGMFRDTSLIAWLGLVVATQNIVGSLFNSHIGDFAQGWIYVFGIGVIGGMIQRRPRARAAARK